LLGQVETQSNKKEVREARKKIKHAIHKRERNIGKQQLRHIIDHDDEESLDCDS
jgi:hypothetical protein